MASGTQRPLVTTATAPDGVALAVQEWGNPAGAEILLIHGVAQSHLSFARQFASPLARDFRIVSFDLRGHGLSAKPLEQAAYQDGRRWADDVRAVMAAVGLRRPVLVGWSLGGRVLRAYLMHHGDAGLGGINIVSSRPIEHPGVVVPPPGPADDPSASPLAQRIGAIDLFLRACFATPPEPADFAAALAFNAMLPWEVREAIAGWSTPPEAAIAALRRVKVPMLITHGRRDRLILLAAAEMTAAAVPHARVSWYEQCGHSPFYEDAPRFNQELAELVALTAGR